MSIITFKTCYLLLLAFNVAKGNEDIKPCPESCTCAKFQTNSVRVDCTRLKYKTVPDVALWPSNTLIVDVSMNDIKKIDKLNGTDFIEYLDLASNDIETIDESAFAQMPNLAGIDLSHNQLSVLPEHLFDALSNLRTLNLSNNDLQVLPNELLAKNIYLNELRLGHNPLRHIDASFFIHTAQLTSLDLSHIEAFSLPDGLFHTLYELLELDLSDNDFAITPTNAIRSARKVQTLKLSGNPIKFLDEHSFLKISTLQEVYLDNMHELVEIKHKTFTHLHHLKKISISNNPQLSYIDKNAFIGMFNKTWLALQEIDIRANRLSTLSEQTLPWCNISVIDLRENSWVCDCNFKWIKECHLRPELAFGIICHFPEKLRGIDLSTVSADDLKCDHMDYNRDVKMMQMFTIVFVSFVFFSIIILFALYVKREQVVRWFTDRRRGNGAIYYVKAHSNPIEQDM